LSTTRNISLLLVMKAWWFMRWVWEYDDV
jgi:hypothetical protein